jgi:hypothetical protein
MPDRKPKRPRDINELGVTIAKLATGELEEEPDTREQAAVSLGRRGGKARAERLTADQRRESARRAASARWQGVGSDEP